MRSEELEEGRNTHALEEKSLAAGSLPVFEGCVLFGDVIVGADLCVRPSIGSAWAPEDGSIWGPGPTFLLSVEHPVGPGP